MRPLKIYLVFNSLFLVGFVRDCETSSGPGPCVSIEPPAPGRIDTLCIPVDVVNAAFTAARRIVNLMEPYPHPLFRSEDQHEIDKLGQALTETSRILVREYKLNALQAFYLLPKVNVALTEIWNFCPVQYKEKDNCEISAYRSLSGYCNNLHNPTWGSANIPFQNLLAPVRPDGVSEPKGFGEGSLPSARVVSATMHRDTVVHDHAITIMLIAWGQIIDHDITLTAETKDPHTLEMPDCCTTRGVEQDSHHNCFPIEIPPDDSFYSHYGHQCMNFLRSFTGVRSECRLGPRTAFNTISSYLDANFAYGSDPVIGRDLRLGKHGMLRSLAMLNDYGLKDLLPLKMDFPDDGCIRPSEDMYCFLAGDVRVNEQLVLTVLHTIFMREHNRIAQELEVINPHWDDERLFQETRRIVIAITQHITFEEFLPMILGRDLMHEYGLSVQKEGYWSGYDPHLDATVTEEFITSAFRFGHSLLPNKIERWSLGHTYIDSENLSKLLRQPFDVYRPGFVDTFVMGMVNQLAQAMDEGVTEQVTTLLFKEPQQPFGMDLAAMNVQRGRDHGVPGYTAYREICGLSPIVDWDDLYRVMKNDTVHKYRSIYRSPHDIDLWSGGVSEIPGPGSLLSPTFGCIIARQFHGAKYGDRFWYELPDLPSSFTLEQLKEIRSMKLSRLLCDNTDAVKTVQVYAMVYPDHEINPRVPCEGHLLPRMNLEKWRDISVDIEHAYKYKKNASALHPHHVKTQSYEKSHYYAHTNKIATPTYHKQSKYHKEETLSDFKPSIPLGINDPSVFDNRPSPHPLTYPVTQPPINEAFKTYEYDQTKQWTNDNSEWKQNDLLYGPTKPPPSASESTLTRTPIKSYLNNNGYEWSASNLRPPVVQNYQKYPKSNYEYEASTVPSTASKHDHYYYPRDVVQENSYDTEKYRDFDYDGYHTGSEENQPSFNQAHSYYGNEELVFFPDPPPSEVKVRIPQRPFKHVRRRLPRIKPFPNSPFPGLSGLFSPNPGYLVRQKFSVPLVHVPLRPWWYRHAG